MQETTLDKIKQISINLFNEKSYEGTSLKDIFNLIGISAPSFYYYYSSKKDLYIELIKDAEELHRKAFMEVLEKSKAKSSKQQLEALIKQYWVFKAENPDVANFLARNALFPPFEFREEIWAMLKEQYIKYHEFVQEIVKNGMETNEINKEVSVDYIVKMFFQMLIGSYINVSAPTKDSLEDKVNFSLRVLFEGIGA